MLFFYKSEFDWIETNLNRLTDYVSWKNNIKYKQNFYLHKVELGADVFKINCDKLRLTIHSGFIEFTGFPSENSSSHLFAIFGEIV